jgi:DNA repair photolyase
LTIALPRPHPAPVRPVANPPNPWRSSHIELLEPAPPEPLAIYEETARSILSKNDSPDVPFSYSVNPCRGCLHGCAYCYARPTHQWLDFGAGTDFEQRLVVKTNAPELLRMELIKRARTLRGEVIAFSGVTDCYQPLEASYALTRQCLEVCRELRQPVGVITKGALVERDADLLADLARGPGAVAHLSIPFLDAADARAIEPQAPSPERRFRSMQTLAAAGVPVGIAIAPVIPGLNDHAIPSLLQAAKAHGARSAFLILLRLPAEVEGVFVERLRAALPLRADRVLSTLQSMHGGRLKEGRFHERMRGRGPRWQAIENLFRICCQRLGLDTGEHSQVAMPPADVALRTDGPRQGTLFGGE